MKINNLSFTADCTALGGQLLSLSETRLFGTEICTYCKLLPENPHAQLWAGVDGSGRLAAAFLDNGHYRTILLPGAAAVGRTTPETADFFRVLPKTDRFRVMLRKTPADETDARVRQCENGDLLQLLSFLHGREPTPQDEAEYVYYARAVNAGLSNAFLLKDEKGDPCACAMILAKNRRYALIGNLYTAPAYRGQGLAGKLLTACQTQAAKEGLLTVVYCKKNMTSFYRAHGYRMVRNHAL